MVPAWLVLKQMGQCRYVIILYSHWPCLLWVPPLVSVKNPGPLCSGCEGPWAASPHPSDVCLCQSWLCSLSPAPTWLCLRRLEQSGTWLHKTKHYQPSELLHKLYKEGNEDTKLKHGLRIIWFTETGCDESWCVLSDFIQWQPINKSEVLKYADWTDFGGRNSGCLGHFRFSSGLSVWVSKAPWFLYWKVSSVTSKLADNPNDKQ